MWDKGVGIVGNTGVAYLEDGAHDEGAQVGDEAVDALAVAALKGHHHHLGPLRQQQLLQRLPTITPHVTHHPMPNNFPQDRVSQGTSCGSMDTSGEFQGGCIASAHTWRVNMAHIQSTSTWRSGFELSLLASSASPLPPGPC